MKQPKPKSKLYKVELLHQNPHRSYEFIYFMDGDELTTVSPILTFQAMSMIHAVGLLGQTQYRGDIEKVKD